MNRQTAREKAASADATTPSARDLANIARKAFLSFWSYLNIFTDAGRAEGSPKRACRLASLPTVQTLAGCWAGCPATQHR